MSTRNLAVGRNGTAVATLDDIVVPAGSNALILGPSGSGKTTALFTLAGLLEPVSGEVKLAGDAFSRLSPGRRRRVRGRGIGLVFQDMHLLGALNVIDNLLLAPFAAGVRPDRTAALRCLEALGLGELAGRRADRLSRGEAQRVAVARAILLRPRIILADEPTASLDDDNARRVAELLLDAAGEAGATLIIATHDRRLMDLFAGRLTLRPIQTAVAA